LAPLELLAPREEGAIKVTDPVILSRDTTVVATFSSNVALALGVGSKHPEMSMAKVVS
jgi:hypothetical protein